jgi:hypothetical protein
VLLRVRGVQGIHARDYYGEVTVKVIRVDSYDDEGPRGTEREVAGPGLSQEEADDVARRMNAAPTRSDVDYFRVVPDEHKLWRFEP